jgi:phage anti-repressor protein
MDHITYKTTTDQLTKIEVPSWCKQYVESAICSSVKLATIHEFIQLTNYPIDKASFDIIYLRIKEDMDVYIDATLLEWMGYEGELKYKQNSFLKLLKRNFTSDEDYTIHKNNGYKEYFKNIKSVHLTPLNYVYPNPAIGASARRIKHILLKPDTFKAMSMMLNTGKGSQIRKYYIAIEKLMKAYMIYQNMFRNREAETAMTCKGNKIDKLELMMIEDRQKAEDRFNKFMAQTAHIIGQNDDLLDQTNELEEKLDIVLPNHVPTRGLKSDEKEQIIIFKFVNINIASNEKNYIVFRGQIKNIDETQQKIITKLSDMRRGNLRQQLQPNEIPQVQIIARIGEQGYIPNARHTWTRFKREYRSNMRFMRGQSSMFNLRNWSIDQFKEALISKDLERLNT